MTESIIQAGRDHCFLCGMNRKLEPLDCHHVFEGVNRKKSERYRLKVYLHHNKCHIFGRESVHGNAGVERALKARVQQMAMEHYGWSIDDFRKIFRKNYL